MPREVATRASAPSSSRREASNASASTSPARRRERKCSAWTSSTPTGAPRRVSRSSAASPGRPLRRCSRCARARARMLVGRPGSGSPSFRISRRARALDVLDRSCCARGSWRTPPPRSPSSNARSRRGRSCCGCPPPDPCDWRLRTRMAEPSPFASRSGRGARARRGRPSRSPAGSPRLTAWPSWSTSRWPSTIVAAIPGMARTSHSTIGPTDSR